jgi:hypothetical protein
LIHPPVIVPVIINPNQIPEDQIALFVKAYMERNGVDPANFLFDGRGSLAVSYARLWSPNVNALEFGGPPTNRPAGPDAWTFDEDTKLRRKKMANEHFSKFVSELWFSVVYAVQADQIRGLTRDIVRDGAPREWRKVKGDRLEVETKRDMKERTGKSPDIFDWLVTLVEAARRAGFVIDNVGASKPSNNNSIFRSRHEDWREVVKSKQLQAH